MFSTANENDQATAMNMKQAICCSDEGLPGGSALKNSPIPWH